MKKIIIVAMLFLFCFGCAQNKIFSEKRIALGTIVQISVVSQDKVFAVNAINKAFDEIFRVQNLLNFYGNASEISKINNAKGSETIINKEVFNLIERCNNLSKMSNGAFDISFASLGNAWKFDENFVPPTKQSINSKLHLVNYKNIILNKKKCSVLLKNKEMKIGLGSIGKRYAIGQAIDVLKKNNVTSAIVLTGGDLQVIGLPNGNNLWNVGVKNPRGDGILYTLKIKSGETVSTSGDYERSCMYNGKRYHHIIDPRTGFPTDTFSSVTVITLTPQNADGLSTALLVAGPKHYKSLLSNFNDVSVIAIDLKMNVFASKKLQGRIFSANKNAPVINWF